MIPITIFKDQTIAVFGLGGSGMATLEALAAGGTKVLAYDDNEASREKAAAIDGVEIADLHTADWSDIAALVLAPGVPLTHPEPHWSVQRARDAGVEIIGDIELFCRQRHVDGPNCPFIAITGTNGKSTTTALVAHLLKEAGMDVQMGGNIGTPILALEPFVDDRIYVIEVSSYQIDLAPGIDPNIGLLLNISADHLDRHGDLSNYARIKARLVGASNMAVVGLDDRLTANIASQLRLNGRAVATISGFGNERAMLSAPDGVLQSMEGDFLFNLDQARALRGTHNAQNAAAAVSVVRQLDVPPAVLSRGLISFGGLEHRMEEVGEKDGLLFINDSKATNADAASRALNSFRSIRWIAGGLAKEGGIETLVDYFDRIEHAYLIGEAAAAFADTLSKGGVPFSQCGHMDVALARAVEDAKESNNAGKERVILLSPACASFDQFPNFMRRGDVFRDAVHAYLNSGTVPVDPAHAK
ncbi:UDP-N-acetylmuramoylalanine--D-glutamate ligase [Cohaesibacter sp. ES.047]|uniref:UDP-N-acetylmuramoyl-L-alanine--D-glutamate ligase n=1 Tax=Cohaesibacter sp. ES.047 TaxID=1798205 RepID=UPI000BB81962|nr:UDP-N-acetylmuramoyl-L-alanine--D-glutamate ligase [Cohaesibacter sp. ES.047]SNY94374.1 UDP-N-acetylmuramoylalanine--D-glutamate ligase [Cohaesibacter sp. ES.047]